MDLSLLIGLISIALGLFLGIFFGLAGFRKGVTSELSTIKEAVIAIRTTADRTWDLILRQFAPSSGTVIRKLGNLGEVKITAEPGEKETAYFIDIEKPILKDGPIFKSLKEPEFLNKEVLLLGKEGSAEIFTSRRMRYDLPSTDPKNCTAFITFLLNWLDSRYVESLTGIRDFEEPILS